MKTFIRCVEVWVPDLDHSLLEFASGYYGDTKVFFGAASRQMCFGRGEGLPGQAWELRRPVVLNELQGHGFRRSKAAAAEGLTSAVAWPVFAGESLRAVVVILCGDDEAHVGAIELWRNEENDADLKLDAGYYGGTAELFEFVSRNTRFRKGTGLPGLAWESGLPVFMPDLGKGSKFIRANSAEQVGINRGFGLPCPVPGPDTYVMAMLSALATPLVRRFEIWLPDAAGTALARTQGHCEVEGTLRAVASADGVPAGQGVLGQALATGTPAVAQPAGEQPGPVGFAARGAGLKAVVALPVISAERVVAVVAWYF